MNFPSTLLENAVEAFASLPGIGRKTALRLVLHLLNQEPSRSERFGEAILKMRREIRFCARCHNISDHALCSICENPGRDKQTVCVVENIRDLLAIEGTNHYRGLYHVLGGVISPVDGVGPEDIQVESLAKRVEEDQVKELIMALNPTIEGDTTVFYISRRLEKLPVNVTTLARGVAFGSELEYTDELTLARSLATRLPYQNQLTGK